MATVAGSLRNKVLVLDDVTTGDLTVTGSVTISGTATTLNSTNTSINDSLIELNAGLTGSNPNDLGLILERGSTGNNVFIGWDESADKVIVATTTADGTATGNLSLTAANFQAADIQAADISMSTGASSGKFAVMSSAVHGSFDFYNNGTSYFNGQTEVNAEFRISSSNSYTTHFNYQDNGVNIISQANGGSTAIRNNNGDLLSVSSGGNLSVSGTIASGGNAVWNSGNDGSGSGLDADLLDGQHGTYYRNAGNLNTGTIPTARLPNPISISGGNAIIKLQETDVTNSPTWWTVADGGNYSIRLNNTGTYPLQIQTNSNNNAVSTIGLGYATTIQGNTAWHAGNDGSGSGLDADTLDGVQGGSFLRSDANDSYSGVLSLTGELTLATGTTRIDGSDGHPLVQVNSSRAYFGSTNRSVSTIATNSTTGLKANVSGTDYTVWHAGNDGSGSGLDADTLDGKQGADLFNFGYAYSSNNLSRAVGSGAQWYKVASFSGGIKHITMKVHSSGDNTSGADSFFISAGSYGMKANIVRMPSSKYNGTKLVEVRTKYVSGATYEIWVKVDSITTSVGYLQVFMNDSGVTSSLSAGSEPSVGTADATLPVSASDRINYSLQATSKIEAMGGFVVDGSTVWHAGNDGSGSGLDADTVDGIQASSFLRSDTADTGSGKITLTATEGLEVGGIRGRAIGNQTGDFIQLYERVHIGYPSGWGATAAAAPSYGLSTWGGAEFNKGNISGAPLTFNSNAIWHAGNDGSGSGLDADTLDGQHGSHYLNYNNLTNKPTIPTNNNQLTNGAGYITSSGTANQSNMVTGSAFATTSSPGSVLEYQQASSITDTKLAPSGDWYNTIRMGHGNPYSYYSNTIAMQMTGSGAGKIRTQLISNNSAQGWRTVWDSTTLPEESLPRYKAYSAYTTVDEHSNFISFYNISTGSPGGSYWSGIQSVLYNDQKYGWQLIGNSTNNATEDLYIRKINNNSYGSWSRLWTASSDGSGSGLDADLLDGQHGSHYLNYNNFTNTPTIPTNNNQLTNGAGYTTFTANQSLNTSNSPTFNQITTTNNGNGTNIKIGDDAWFGDTNVANTIQLTGVQNTTQGYLVFGSSDNTQLGRSGTGNLTYGGNTVWHAGTDGSGSGLDADTVDGIQGASLLRSDAADTASGALTFTGNINQTSGTFISHGSQVSSLTTAWQAAGTSKSRGLLPFRFQNGATGQPESGDNAHWGLNIYAHSGSSGNYPYGTQLSAGSTQNLWHRWWANGTAQAWRKIWDTANDGSGSGLDADTLDGQQGSYYLNYNNFTNTPSIPSSSSFITTSSTAQTKSGILTLSGGLIVDGSIDSGGTDMGFYQSAGTNIVLKGDSNGRSGIFFQSEKNGTNINHPSDYGFIQFHPYGYGNTSGEVINMVIGTANDSNDQLILQTPYTTGLKFGYKNATSGTGLTTGAIWHFANDGAGSGLDADTVDGINSGSFLRSDTADTATGRITLQYGVTSDFNSIGGTQGVTAFYAANVGGVSNRPDTGNYATGLEFVYHDTSARSQLAAGSVGSNNQANFYVRSEAWSSNSWTSWYKLWHTGNDGSGSGLDADTVDGIQGGSFLRSDAADIATQPITLSGGSGTSAGLVINRNIATPSNYYNGLQIEVRATSGTAGIGLHRNGYSHAGIYHDASNTLKFNFNSGTVTMDSGMGTLWGSGNDGSGSGLDADTLDGSHKSSFLVNTGSGDFTYNPGGSSPNILLGHDPTTNVGSALIAVIKQTAQYAPGLIRFYISPTGTTNSTSNTYKKFEFQHDGDLHADGDVIAYSTTTGSDRKLKENIRNLEGSLDKTLKLRGVKFDWKDEKRANDQLGFIAQEVQEVLPEVVKEVETLTKEGETHLTVNYPAVVPLLVEAIKEQQSIINRLEERLSDLESKLK